MEQVTAAGGVVCKGGNSKQPQVLLIFRRNIWDLPKGKLEEGESIEECAVREVAEEVGAPVLPQIYAPLIKTYHEYRQNDTDFGKTTHWFAMQFLSVEKLQFHPQKEEDIARVQWFPLERAKQEVGFKNLVDVLRALKGRLPEGND